MAHIITPEQTAFDDVAQKLAVGEEVDADRVVLVLAASGRTVKDLEAAADRLAGRIARGMVLALHAGTAPVC